MATDEANSSLSSQTDPITNPPLVLLNLPIATKLTRSNYLAWQCQITPLLHGYGLYKFVDPTSSPPAPTIPSANGTTSVNPEYLHHHKQDHILLGWLRSSLSESLLGQTSFATTSAALWDYLQKSFSAVSRARLSALLRQLRTTVKGSTLLYLSCARISCSDYIQQMRSVADELSFIGAPVSDEDLMRYILEGLGSEFNSIVVTANARSKPFSFTDLMSIILSHEGLLQSQLSSLSAPATNNPIGFYSNPRPAPPAPPNQYSQPHPTYRPNSRPRAPRPQNLVFYPPPNSFIPNTGPPLLPNPPTRPAQQHWAPFTPNRPTYQQPFYQQSPSVSPEFQTPCSRTPCSSLFTQLSNAPIDIS